MPKTEFRLFCTAAVLIAGDTMDKVSTIHQAEKLLEAEELTLPVFPDECLDKVFRDGKSMNIDGTNVVRVPFGVRQPRKQRPQRPERWATLVLPLQPLDSPNPPPQAA